MMKETWINGEYLNAANRPAAKKKSESRFMNFAACPNIGTNNQHGNQQPTTNMG